MPAVVSGVVKFQIIEEAMPPIFFFLEKENKESEVQRGSVTYNQ